MYQHSNSSERGLLNIPQHRYRPISRKMLSDEFYYYYFFGFRNLSYNPLKYFAGSVNAVLPSLTVLDLTGVKTWVPDKLLSKLPLLKNTIGFSLGSRCSNCSLFVPDTMKNISFTYTFKSGYCDVIQFNLSGVLEKLANIDSDFRFHFTCDSPLKCFQAHLDYSKISKLYNVCWNNSLTMMKFMGVLGLIGLFINLVVVLNILCCKELRSNNSMLFVCNMGASDFLLSVFSLCLLVHLSSHSYDHLYRSQRTTNWKIGFLWVMGQCGSVITSFYLTLERYFAVVYAMNPNIRIHGRLAYLMILICWFVAIFFTAYAMYFQFYSQSIFCIPIRVRYSIVNSHIFIFSLVIGMCGIFLYLTSLLLYVHIYICVQRSANNAGVKRESKIARRIALLVLSNIFFYCFPLAITGSVAVAIPGSMPITSQVGLLLSVTINSFVNPWLYAFRNDRFTKVLRDRIKPYFICISKVASDNAVTVQTSTNGQQ